MKAQRAQRDFRNVRALAVVAFLLAFVAGSSRVLAEGRSGLGELIAQAKRDGSILGPDVPSAMAIEQGLITLGPPAVPEALEILRVGQEPPEILAGLLSGLIRLDRRVDPDVERVVCHFLRPERPRSEAALFLATAALEGLRISKYRCPGAVRAAIEIYESSADLELRIGLIAIVEKISATKEEVEALKDLLARERDEVLRAKLQRALDRIAQRLAEQFR